MIGRVYKITNADESIIYIGSTTMSLSKRWSAHKTNFRRMIEGNRGGCSIFYQFQQYGVDAFSIHLISEYEIDNQNQLFEFEQLVLDQTPNSINTQRAYRTNEQRREYERQRRANNRDHIRNQYRTYYQANREIIDQRKSVQKICECGSSVSSRNMAQHRRSQKHQRLMEQQSD